MKRIELLLLLLLSTAGIYSQEIRLQYENESLDKILLDIRDTYGLNLSFSNDQLSQFSLSVNKGFTDPREALGYLIADLPYEIDIIGSVYIIKQKRIIEKRDFLLTATILDRKTGERLPYAHILANSIPLISNSEGAFSLRSKTDSVFHIQVSYLGFHSFDTILKAPGHYSLRLEPAIYEMDELEISSSRPIHYTGDTRQSGGIRLNTFVANYLPGNGDQSVFNLLRLQPGILAAGEQTSDLLIWGSYEGQTSLSLDGITLFNLKNYNDNISTINPLLAKDLNVIKAGYGIEHNGRVGGVVEVSGKDGSKTKPEASLNINNQTLSGLVSVPLLRQRASLILAMRQTYYELYDKGSIAFGAGRNENTGVDRVLYPDYNFGDLNLKFSGDLNDNTSLQISYLRAKDDYSYGLLLDGKQSNFNYDEAEHNIQSGFSGRIHHFWKNGINSQLQFSGSSLNRKLENHQQRGRGQGGSGARPGAGSTSYMTLLNNHIENQIDEQTINLVTSLQAGDFHRLKFITGYKLQRTAYYEDSVDLSVHRFDNEISILNLGVNEDWAVTNRINLRAGFLFQQVLKVNEGYFQPRLSLAYKLTEDLDVRLAYGYYDQFVTRLPHKDDFDNIRYFWLNSDFENISAQRGVHKVLTIHYKHKGYKFDMNLFQRNIRGLTRFGDYSFNSELYKGESVSKGLDFLLSKTFEKLNFWISYTYSKTTEHFDYFESDEFQRAMHDQRHELKTALVWRYRKWYFSTNYVYGSGFPQFIEDMESDDYNRWDIAINRSINYKKLKMSAGFSILNLLNHRNIKYDNFYRLEDEEGVVNVHAEPVPFTPTLYFNIAF